MTRLGSTLDKVAGSERKALGIFVTAGYPTLDSTPEILECLDDAGVDFIELGMPFSDPLAEGRTIQETSAVALANGVNLSTVLAYSKRFRKTSTCPLVLMGYINPVFSFGYSNFFAAAASSGVDGVIIADLPVHESQHLVAEARRHNVDVVHLITPNTQDDRIALVDQQSSGFVYAVALIGLTGANLDGGDFVGEYLNRARGIVKKNKLLAGFGIRTGEDANALSTYCDGVIVGSAFLTDVVAAWQSYPSMEAKRKAVRDFVERVRPSAGTFKTPVG